MNMLLASLLLSMLPSSTNPPPAIVTIIEPRDHIVAARDTWRPYSGGWTPMRADVIRAKSALMAWLESPDRQSTGPDHRQAALIAVVGGHIGHYALQYLGVRYRPQVAGYDYDAMGRRGVLIHGLSMQNGVNMAPNALDREYLVFDGGTNYFDTLIDADTGAVVQFSVHGIA